MVGRERPAAGQEERWTSRVRRETVRETVLGWNTPLFWALRRSFSARARSSEALSEPGAPFTARIAFRTVERTCLLRACRLSDWRWRFLAEG